MKLTVTLTEAEVLAIVQEHLMQHYPRHDVKKPSANVFTTGDRFDRPTGHSFHVTVDLVDKPMADYLK